MNLIFNSTKIKNKIYFERKQTELNKIETNKKNCKLMLEPRTKFNFFSIRNWVDWVTYVGNKI